MSQYAQEIAKGQCFSFGKNSGNFLRHLNEQWIARAVSLLRTMLGVESLEEKRIARPSHVGYVRGWTCYPDSSLRGMSKWHDLIDWIEGYPFEVAKPEQIFDFLVG